MEKGFFCRLAASVWLGLVLAGGCADAPDPAVQEGAEPEAGADTVGAAQPDTSGGPVSTRRDTILLEGMPQPITVKLFETADNFPLPFYTYYPEDMLAQVISVGDYGETIRFTSNFGGVMRDDALVQMYMLPEGLTEADARILVREDAQTHESAREVEDHRYGWSLAEYVVEDSAFVGAYALGRHGGRYFQVLVGYPPEYGDGFGPRSHLILESWRWKDTGQALE